MDEERAQIPFTIPRQGQRQPRQSHQGQRAHLAEQGQTQERAEHSRRWKIARAAHKANEAPQHQRAQASGAGVIVHHATDEDEMGIEGGERRRRQRQGEAVWRDLAGQVVCPHDGPDPPSRRQRPHEMNRQHAALVGKALVGGVDEDVGRPAIGTGGHRRMRDVEAHVVGEICGVHHTDERRHQEVVQRRLPGLAQPHILSLGRLHGQRALGRQHTNEGEVPQFVRRFK